MSTNLSRQHTRSTSTHSHHTNPEVHIQISRDPSPADHVLQQPHQDISEVTSIADPGVPKAEEDVWYPHGHADDESGDHKEGEVNFQLLHNYAETDIEECDYKEDEKPIKPGYLENGERDPEKTFVQRKYSHYGNPAKYPSDDETAERFTFYSNATGTIRARTLIDISYEDKKLADLLKEGDYWIDVLAPTPAEMKMMSKVFRIHPLTAEDIQMQETREKCEIFGSYMFVSFRSFDQDHYSSEYMKPLSFYNVVLRSGILTFHFKPTPHPHKVRKRIRQLKDFINVTPDWINYALIDDITDSFAPLIQQIELEVDSIDDLVLLLRESEQSDMLRRIGHCRKKVMQLLRLLSTKADVVKGLMKRFEDKVKELQAEATGGAGMEPNKMAMHHNVALYLGDIQDHIITMTQNLNHYDKILARSHSNYLAQISIELAQTSSVTNDAVGRLSAFATIIAPMNLVTGLWGMNIKVPGRDQEDLVWFFWILCGMAMFGVVGVSYGKRVGFL